MPSPFPGMDPYLENPARWPGVHHGIIFVSLELLARQLRPRYLVRVEERVYISDDEDPGRKVLIPDLRIAEAPGRKKSKFAPGGNGGLQVAEPLVVTTLLDDEIHEAFVTIIDAVDKKVVTLIEVLSPSNKVKGSRGRADYSAKRMQTMDSPTHLVEIDLLRAGQRIPMEGKRVDCHYLVHVSRVEKRPKGLVWPIHLDQRLPEIAIPLKAGDADAKLDLQEVLTTVYDRTGFDLDTDYSKPPEPPFTPEEAEWAEQLLRGKGLR